ncbi:MAG: type II toxin-antitoxin system prevent-host-death family antitoxin [Actinomycetes bacterium]
MTTTAKKTKKARESERGADSTINTQSVGVRELRQSASKILDQVKDGVVFEITEHGVPVARLVPITKSLYEEYIAAGLIIPAENPITHFEMPTFKLKGKKTSTEVLMEMRAEERY